MPIEIVPYTRDRTDAVIAFNRRMREGGSGYGWYESADEEWLPKRPEIAVWREHFVAVEDGALVRGAYALKPQPWQIRGETRIVADWQGPVSEGVVSERHVMLGIRLFRDMLKRQPLLYSWGHGGDDAPMLQLVRTLKWPTHGTPFCLKVLRPFRFLRNAAYLRKATRQRQLLDALAFSGLGTLGLEALFTALQLRGRFGSEAPRLPSSAGLDAEPVDAFGEWADTIWSDAANAYLAIGLRDASTLNALMPAGAWPKAIRLRIRSRGETLGWAAVMDNRLQDDPRFGSMRVGSVIDCLARPEQAPVVIAAATRFLAQRGVDMIASNQSHPAWIRAFATSGYLVLPGRRQFAASPPLFEALAPFDETSRGLHLTNLDGHGPHGL